LFEKPHEKPPATGSKIAKMLPKCGAEDKTRRFSVFLSHFSKIIFEKGLIRQFQRFALSALGRGRRSRPTGKMPRRGKLLRQA
jgi:hypothetical protein